jgi:hypothetical protein
LIFDFRFKIEKPLGVERFAGSKEIGKTWKQGNADAFLVSPSGMVETPRLQAKQVLV